MREVLLPAPTPLPAEKIEGHVFDTKEAMSHLSFIIPHLIRQGAVQISETSYSDNVPIINDGELDLVINEMRGIVQGAGGTFPDMGRDSELRSQVVKWLEDHRTYLIYQEFEEKEPHPYLEDLLEMPLDEMNSELRNMVRKITNVAFGKDIDFVYDYVPIARELNEPVVPSRVRYTEAERDAALDVLAQITDSSLVAISAVSTLQVLTMLKSGDDEYEMRYYTSLLGSDPTMQKPKQILEAITNGMSMEARVVACERRYNLALDILEDSLTKVNWSSVEKLGI